MGVSKKKSGWIKGDLIPGLPEELAMECLVRVPFEFHSSMKHVCRSWKCVISRPSFNKERISFGKAESLLCLVQPLTPVMTDDDGGEKKKEEEEGSESQMMMIQQQQQQPRLTGTPLYGLSVYNATLDTWHRVAIPERIPLFCECVAVQDAGKVLLIGGWDPETLQPVRDVFVLDFFAGEGSGRRWRRGKPMSAARSFFACASAGSRKVYVAGGHDDQKNALRSAEVYDVEKDEWTTLPPMTEGRDECHGFSMATDLGFCVLSGYGTETQGQFRSDGEIYDPVSNSWSVIENVWPFPDLSPRGRTATATATAAAAESAGDFRGCRLWCFIDSERQSQPRWEIEDDSMKWKVVMETIRLPVTTMTSVFAGSLSGQAVAMIGGGGEESGTMMVKATTAEKNGGKWIHVNTPSGFSSLPFSYSSIYV
ncbi:PREDICTED: F-box/kelch-repeat protein SKIP20 [Camelina sativa]|uniref:F-box/kelch-repeat protein SKIP20 n=1 Tax=Camelina sativa TaxID=90675 RepID=A0ABM0SN13_CAMSA|nr:PREDICTED: F-box/kelch-repeat protein SKIP20 [Camelina sativa]